MCSTDCSYSHVVQCIYMNNTMPIGMKSELDEIKSEVRSLHNTMGKLVKLTTRLLTRLKGIEGIRLYLDVRSTATGERVPARRHKRWNR